MRYREFKPNLLLAAFVECFWTLESDASFELREPQPILPDGCVELILNFGARFTQHNDDGRERRQPRHFLVGQMTQAMTVVPTGSVRLLGIRFQPGGTFPLLKVPMQEVTNQIVELGALKSGLERDLLARAGAPEAIEHKVAAVEDLLTERFLQVGSDSSVASLAARIVQTAGRISVDQLADDAGVSSRQLERRFLREVGIGPKLLCRLLRFQQVFRAVEHNHGGWAGVAVDCGYYDHSHLIRDFQQFAGRTPAALFAQGTPLTEAFTRKHRTSDFSNTSA